MKRPATPSPANRVGALMFVVQPLYILAELLTAAAVTAPYSLFDNTISDLGATTCRSIEYAFGPVPVCSPWHLLVNTSFVVFGLLLALGALLLRSWLPARPMATAAVALWVVAGLSSVGTGVVPLDQDLEMHAAVSLPVFLAQPLALLATALVVRDHPGLARTGHAAGLVSLAATATFLAVSARPELGGLFERLALWPGYVWLSALGLTALDSLARARSARFAP